VNEQPAANIIGALPVTSRFRTNQVRPSTVPRASDRGARPSDPDRRNHERVHSRNTIRPAVPTCVDAVLERAKAELFAVLGRQLLPRSRNPSLSKERCEDYAESTTTGRRRHHQVICARKSRPVLSRPPIERDRLFPEVGAADSVCANGSSFLVARPRPGPSAATVSGRRSRATASTTVVRAVADLGQAASGCRSILWEGACCRIRPVSGRGSRGGPSFSFVELKVLVPGPTGRREERFRGPPSCPHSPPSSVWPSYSRSSSLALDDVDDRAWSCGGGPTELPPRPSSVQVRRTE